MVMCDSSAASVRVPGAACARPVTVGRSAGAPQPAPSPGAGVVAAVGVCLPPQLADVSVSEFQGEHAPFLRHSKVTLYRCL
jgi:hypothetical protein